MAEKYEKNDIMFMGTEGFIQYPYYAGCYVTSSREKNYVKTKQFVVPFVFPIGGSLLQVTSLDSPHLVPITV